MRAVRGVAAGVLALAVAFAVATWVALEWSDVARIETRAEDGHLRSTHVWYAVRDGALWVEAGARDNPWFVDALREPRVAIVVDGERREVRAVVVDDDRERALLRAALRARYGWRDAWVGMLVDASQSVPVRLDP